MSLAASFAAQKKARKHFLKNNYNQNTDSLQGISWTNTFTEETKQNQAKAQTNLLSFQFMALLQYLVLLMGHGFVILFFYISLFNITQRGMRIVPKQSLHLVDNFISCSHA